MPTRLSIESYSSLRDEPRSALKGEVILYFNAGAVDAADPTAFCKAEHCPRLSKEDTQGRKPKAFYCTGPTPFDGGKRFLARMPFNRTITDHVDTLLEEASEPIEIPCGANKEMFFNTRVPMGG